MGMVKVPRRTVQLCLSSNLYSWATPRWYKDCYQCSLAAVRTTLLHPWRSSPLTFIMLNTVNYQEKAPPFPPPGRHRALTGCIPVTSVFFNKASYCKYTFHYFTARWSLATILDTALKTKSFYQTVPSLGTNQQSCCDGPEPRISLCLHLMLTKRK